MNPGYGTPEKAHPKKSLGKQRLDHFAMDVREAELTALEPVGEPLMIDPQLMQQRGMQIVDVDRVLHYIETELVRLAMAGAGLDAATRHPEGETAPVVVTAVFLTVGAALGVTGPAEFAPEDDQGVVEQATPFKSVTSAAAG